MDIGHHSFFETYKRNSTRFDNKFFKFDFERSSINNFMSIFLYHLQELKAFLAHPLNVDLCDDHLPSHFQVQQGQDRVVQETFHFHQCHWLLLIECMNSHHTVWIIKIHVHERIEKCIRPMVTLTLVVTINIIIFKINLMANNVFRLLNQKTHQND